MKFLSRLSEVLYWLCCFVCILILFFTIENLFNGGGSHWIGLMMSVFVYILGWSIRYVVTGDKGHLFARMYRKHIKK